MTTAILGISAFYHDSAAALVVDGEIVAAAQEERFTRRKGDASFPDNAIAFCLHQAALAPADLACAVFYEKPISKFGRLLESHLAIVPNGVGPWLDAIPVWLRRRLWEEERMRKGIGLSDGAPFLYAEHHESHAASAFFPSPFDSAAVLTVDGVGEWATTTIGAGKGNQLSLIEEQRFPHSLGLLYSAFTSYLGFRVNSGEYKVMGLAPYGRPLYVDRIREHLIEVYDDGSLRLDLSYFAFLKGKRMTSAKFHMLMGGAPKAPDAPVTQREMDIARSIQDVTDDVMLRLARHARARTGEKRLVLAGGVALNCVANARILKDAGFEDIWIQPAAGDAGGALGAALAVWHGKYDAPRAPRSGDAMHSAYLGPSYSDDEIAAALDAAGAVYQRHDSAGMLNATVDMLLDGKVVAWFQDRMEYGPRSLGCRSILADARVKGMQSRLNLSIKFRESFRPFAPAVLEEHVSEYFELDRPSPYMLLVAPVEERQRLAYAEGEAGLWGMDLLNATRSTIPAVTHVDWSARLQTVSEANRMFYRLLTRFNERSGCPVLVNTSMNVRGEPIVCRPAEAFQCLMRTEIDVLAIGSFIVRRADQSSAVAARYSNLPVEAD